MQRYWELDFTRGAAVIFMVVFHFAWDLKYFGFTSENLYAGAWGIFQKLIVTMFLFLLGVSLYLSYAKRKEAYATHFAQRALIVFGGGMLITIFTLIAFPGQFIYFGILHLIGASILFSIPLVKRKNLSLAIGLALVVLPFFTNPASLGIRELVWLGLSQPLPTLDFSPVIPWFGVVLLGIWFTHSAYPNGKPAVELRRPELPIGLVEFAGKNALAIYFLHQPVLFTSVYIASLVF